MIKVGEKVKAVAHNGLQVEVEVTILDLVHQGYWMFQGRVLEDCGNIKKGKLLWFYGDDLRETEESRIEKSRPVSGINLIVEERKRQKKVEGYSLNHDRNHSVAEFVRATISYGFSALGALEEARKWWPWEIQYFKPKGTVRDLVRSAALSAAGIDRAQGATEKGDIRYIINFAKDFTDSPGGRYREDGPKSGQEFRNDYIIPIFQKLKDGEIIYINLDGCYGFPVSFLEEVFGGLARIYGKDEILKKIVWECKDEPNIEKDISEYIFNAVKLGESETSIALEDCKFNKEDLFDTGTFRGKSKETGEWVYGSLVKERSGKRVIYQYEPPIFTEVKPETIGQCIGAADKNKNYIFEGDIVKTGDYGNEDPYEKAVVVFDQFGFMLESRSMKGCAVYFDCYTTWKMEIIGNEFDGEKENV